MKPAVAAMTWNLNQIRQTVFWLTLVTLPWQTRWFQEGPSQASRGTGRISIYISWILILVCMICVLPLLVVLAREDPSVQLASSFVPLHHPKQHHRNNKSEGYPGPIRFSFDGSSRAKDDGQNGRFLYSWYPFLPFGPPPHLFSSCHFSVLPRVVHAWIVLLEQS